MLLLHSPPDYIKDVLISILKSTAGELSWAAGKEGDASAAAAERPWLRRTDGAQICYEGNRDRQSPTAFHIWFGRNCRKRRLLNLGFRHLY